jgi:DNA replication protein DnaC
MLTHPTLDLLHSLGLHGMAKGFKDLDAQSEARSLEHAEWLALLLEHEKTLRQQKRFESRARAAKLRHAACVEDVDYRAVRGLDRTLFLKLAAGDWIRARHNLLVTGPCGVGKSWLACALGNKACRDDFSVAYHRVPRLFAALALGRADGRYTKMLRAIARLDLLILDDRGPEPLDADQRRDLLEIVEDRYEISLDYCHQPAPVESLVRNSRKPHHRRRDPRSPRSQCLPHRTQRREPQEAEANRSRSIGLLTFPALDDIMKLTHANDATGGRLQIGMPGRLRIGMHGRLRRNPHRRC